MVRAFFAFSDRNKQVDFSCASKLADVIVMVDDQAVLKKVFKMNGSRNFLISKYYFWTTQSSKDQLNHEPVRDKED
jgi:hypothetical protein